jgi:hypothetical protein
MAEANLAIDDIVEIRYAGKTALAKVARPFPEQGRAPSVSTATCASRSKYFRGVRADKIVAQPARRVRSNL